MNYQRHRMHDVINMVTQRLIEIKRFQAAAELHESIDDAQGECFSRPAKTYGNHSET